MRNERRHSPAALLLPLCIGLFLIASFVFGPVFAATTDTVAFQSKLVNADGTNITNGTYNLRFRIYDAASAGTLIWSEDQSVVVTDGVLSVQLGTVTAFSTSDFNDDRYLQVCFDANSTDSDSSDTNCGSGTHRYEEVFTTRKPITAVPIAINARHLIDSMGNSFSLANFFQLGGNDGNEGDLLLGSRDEFALKFMTDDIERMVLDTNGRLGIGTSSPTAGYLLDVAGGITTNTLVNQNTYASIFAKQAGILVQDGSAGTGTLETISGHNFEAFQFTATSSTTLGSIGVRLQTSAGISNSTEVSVNMYFVPDSGGEPDFSAPTPMSHILVDRIDTILEEHIFYLADNDVINLTSGQQYWVVVQIVGAPVGGNVQLDRGSSGSDNYAYSDEVDGSIWTTETNKNVWFKLYGMTAGAIYAESSNGVTISAISRGQRAAIYGQGVGEASILGVNWSDGVGVYGSSDYGDGGYFESNYGNGVTAYSNTSSIDGYGVYGYSGVGTGVIGASTTGIGVRGRSESNAGGEFISASVNDNTVETALIVGRQVSPNLDPGADGVGVSIDFKVYDSASVYELASRIASQLVDATSGNETSNLTFWTRNEGGALTSRLTLDGAGNLLPTTTDVYALGSGMDQTAAFMKVFGDEEYSFFGHKIANLGDINNDGFDDFAVAASEYNGAGSDRGRVYVYYGGPTLDATADLTLNGEADYDSFGFSVSGAGDVNNDTYDDFIVGAPGFDNGSSGEGKAYIYFGGATPDGTADVTLVGTTLEQRVGGVVTGVGDVNNDTYDDVVIGASGAAGGGIMRGEAYLLLGGASMDNTVDVTFSGVNDNDQIGYIANTIAPAGDVNNDNYDDVIIGNPYSDTVTSDAGEVYIFYGGASMNNVADVTIPGTFGGEYFGFTVVAAGDINDDTYGDILISNAATGVAPKVELYYGGASMNTTPDTTFSQNRLEYSFGETMTVGDFNDDGNSDIAIGAIGGNVGRFGETYGKVYIYSGSSTSVDTVADVVLNGNTADSGFGGDLSVAGDVDGDGSDDLLVGAYYESSGILTSNGNFSLYRGGKDLRWQNVFAEKVNVTDSLAVGQSVFGQDGSIAANSWSVSSGGDGHFSTLSTYAERSYATYGNEMVTNGTFTGGTTGWTLGTGWTYGTDNVVYTNTYETLSQDIGAVPGGYYVLTFTVTGMTGGYIIPGIGGVTADEILSDGMYTVTIFAGGSVLSFTPLLGFDGVIDDISVVQVNPIASTFTVYDHYGSVGLEIRAEGDNNNQFIGTGSGRYNMSNNNVGFGAYTLASNVEGGSNTAVGYAALYSNTGGDNNIAIGNESLYALVNGSRNVAVGRSALESITAAERNVALGYQAGDDFQSGEENVIIGYMADIPVSDFIDSSTVIGSRAEGESNELVVLGARALSRGTSGIAIGYNAESANPGDVGSIAIGAYSVALANYSIALGYGAQATSGNQFVVGGGSGGINEVIIGNGVTNSAPLGFQLYTTSGEGTDIQGGSIVIGSGAGTGAALGGDITFAASYAGTTGASPNSLVNRFTIKANGLIGLGGNISENPPVADFDVFASTRITGSENKILTGSIDPTASTTVTGVDTLFTSELVEGDYIVVSGEQRTVVAIASDTSLTVNEAFSDNANDTSVDRQPAILLVRDWDDWNPHIIVNNTGYVGIGTYTPRSTLSVNGGLAISEAGSGPFHTEFVGGDQAGDIQYTLPTASTNGVLTNTGGVLSWVVGGGGGIGQIGSMTSSVAFGDSSADDDWLGLGASAGRIAFDDQATDYVNILSANVGIGTTNPSSFMLQVAGHIGPDADDTYDLGSDSLRFRDLFLGGDTLHIGTSLTDEGTFAYNTSTNVLGINTDSTTNGDIAFFTDDLYLDKSLGYVGIGTTSPSARFQVSGDNTFASANLASIINSATYTTAQSITGSLLSMSRSMTVNDSAGTAIAYDSSSTGTADSTNTVTWAHTVASNTNRVLVVGVSTNSNARATSVTYNAVQMTKIGELSDSTEPYERDRVVSMWYLVAPATGTNNVVVTTDINTRIRAGASTYYNVNQSTPVGQYNVVAGSGANPSVSVVSQVGQLVVDAAVWGSGSGTVGGGQTSRWNFGSTIHGAGSSKSASAGTTTMTWTVSATSHVIMAATLNPLTTLGYAASVAEINSNCAVSAGVCADNSTLLSVNQLLSGSTGSVLGVSNAGTGLLANFDTTNARGNGIRLDIQSGAFDQYALNVTTNNGANQALYINGLGSVGINNTAPQYALHVEDTAAFENGNNPITQLWNPDNYTAVFKQSTETDGNNVGIGFAASGSLSNIGASIIFKRTGAESQGELQFYTKNSTTAGVSPLQAMVIDNAQNVGIGVAAPSSRLDIQVVTSESSLSSEMITATADRDFSSNTGKWTGTGWTIGSGVIAHTAGANALTLNNTGLSATPTSGSLYQVTFTIDTTTAGTLNMTIGSATNSALVGTKVGVETQVQVLLATGTGALTFTPNATWEGTIDDVSVVLVNPANVAETIRNSDGTVGSELRAGGTGSLSTFVGTNSGQSNVTGTRNTAIGTWAMQNNVSGWNNAALGYQALRFNTNGGDNVAIGSFALRSNTTGSNNTGVGKNALLANTSGWYNTAVGIGTLKDNISGQENTAFGVQALFMNVVGDYNTALGMNALYNALGSRNTAIGYNAGDAVTTGENNVILGYRAGENLLDGSNNIIIGYDVNAPDASLSHQLNIGNFIFGTGFDGADSTISAGKVGLGTTTPGQTLTVNGDFGLLETGSTPQYYTIFEAGDQSGDITYTLPDSSTNGVLTNTGGVLTWVLGGGGGISQVGSMTGSPAFGDATADDDWLGLGASAGRIAFDDQAVDFVNILDAYVGIGTVSPSTRLDITGTLTEGVMSGEQIIDSDDRDFTSSTGNWTGTNWSVTGGQLVHTVGADTVTLNSAALAGTLTGGILYEVTFTVDTTTAGTLYVNIGDASDVPVSGTVGGIDTQTVLIYASNSDSLSFAPDGTWEGVIDDVSVKIVTPSLAVQNIRNADGSIGLELRSGGTGSGNTFVGKDAGVSNVGGFTLTAFGSSALFSNTTGSNNVAVGAQAMFANTSGGANVGVGAAALKHNTTGSYNTAIGENALASNTYAFYNTAVGANSNRLNITGSQNSSFGMQTLFNNVTGYENTAIGMNALYTTTSGYNNTAVGVNAGYEITTGYGNVLFGYHAGDNITDGNRNIVIGSESLVVDPAGDNQLNIGNFIYGTGFDGTGTTMSNGSVGIGINNPGAALHVVEEVTGSGVWGYGVRGEITDNTNNSNTVIGVYGLSTTSGTGNKGTIGSYASATSAATTQNFIVGQRGIAASTGALTSGTHTIAGGYFTATTSGISGGNANVMGGFFQSGGTITSGTIGAYGVYIANAAGMNTTGSVNYGLYVETPTGAATNVGAYIGGAHQGANVVSTSGATTSTVTITTGGLVYDLSKNTGTTDTATTTTYNITGLPNIDGVHAYILTTVTKGATTTARVETVSVQINGSAISSVATASTTAAATVREAYIVVRTNGGWRLATGTTTAVTADLAEWYQFVGEQPIEGALIGIDGETGKVKNSDQSSNALVGVVSTAPFQTMGEQTPDSIRMALSGRVPAIVVVGEGENINPGDEITSSNIAGVGKKASGPGPRVGKALEGTAHWSNLTCPAVFDVNNIIWPADSGKNEEKPCFTLPDGRRVGKVMTFINVYYNSENLPIVAAVPDVVDSTTVPEEFTETIFSRGISQTEELNGHVVSYENISIASGNGDEDTVIYNVEKSNTGDSTVLGVVAGVQDSAILTNSEEHPYKVATFGAVSAWIEEGNVSQNIEPGDEFVLSGDKSGYLSKGVGTVIAKSLESVDWSTVTEVVDGRKVAKIKVFVTTSQQLASSTLAGGDSSYWNAVDETTIQTPYGIIASSLLSTVGEFNVLKARTLNVNDAFTVDDAGAVFATAISTPTIKGVAGGITIEVLAEDTFKVKVGTETAIEASVNGVKVNNLVVSDQQAGKITMPAGQTQITVSSTLVSTDSIVIVTPTKAVTTAVSTNNGTFVIKISAAQTEDIEVGWYIVNVAN